jgi:ubiquinone/menaquinone biosynthesis C-methylase UbiE
MSLTDKAFYDKTEMFDDRTILEVAHTCQLYFQTYRRILDRNFEKRDGISVLELGAGTCCLSLLVSRLPFVKEVYCCDISLKKMRDLLPFSCRHIAGYPEKLRLFEGDFSEKLAFDERSFDLVVFDSALHHSRSIWLTLLECRRVLKNDGMLVCQREAYLGALTFAKKLDELAKSKEVQSGVSENSYLRKQYEYYFRACGFRPTFLPVAETGLQRILMPLNGLLYSKWVILAQKDEHTRESA